MSTYHSSSKLSTKERNDQKWEVHKLDIQSVYIDMDHTLKETMKIIENAHHFTASERKWKEKLKEWKFEKNIAAADMRVLIAKGEKRKRDEGKETRFFYSGTEIKPERFENFKKRNNTKYMDVASPTVATPSDITYRTPGPQTPFAPMAMGIEDVSELSQQTAEIEHVDYLAIFEDLSGLSAGTQKTSRESDNITEGEISTFLPDPSHQSGERHLLIGSISQQSMLWDCPGRGLHTIDEESVIGLDDEILAPLIISDLIENHINGARIDYENHRTKSAVVKYLGAIILAVERKCCSEETIFEYLSEFLDLLEVGPGACVSALQQSLEKPAFGASEYSDVFLLYHEVLDLLCNEFQPTTEVVARICLLLADLETLYPEISHRAEALYGKAMEAYENLGEFDHLLQCQLSLANVLIDLNRFFDAYELLARACSKHLHDHLDLWIDERPSTTSYSLGSLFPESPGVQPAIFRIKCILSKVLKKPRGYGDKYDLYVMMIHEIAALAGILSVETNQSDFFLHLEALDPLWSELFGKILSLDDTTFPLLKAFAYIQRSNYLSNGFNRNKYPNCLDDIITAHRYLSVGGHLRPDLKDQLVQHVEGIRARAVYHPQVQILDLFSLARTSHDLSDVSRPFRRGTAQLQPSMSEAGNDKDDLSESTTISLKYGVRYNNSSKKGLCFTD